MAAMFAEEAVCDRHIRVPEPLDCFSFGASPILCQLLEILQCVRRLGVILVRTQLRRPGDRDLETPCLWLLWIWNGLQGHEEEHAFGMDAMVDKVPEV